MKNLKTILVPGSLFFMMLAVSCSDSNTNKGEDTKEVAEEVNDDKFEKPQEKDAQFLVDAASMNMMEIKLSELAKGSAVSDDCKKLADMMISDHQKSLAEVQALAQKKGVTLPTDLSEGDMKDYNNLNEKKGVDFDKEYCDMMVKGHKDAVDKFEKAANDAADADIKSFASGTLPTLRTHLDHSRAAEEKSNKM